MDPLTVIALTNAALSVLEKSIPVINDLKLQGLITKEAQEELLKKYESLKNTADGQFSGPHWKVE
jgi:hypothetical protein